MSASLPDYGSAFRGGQLMTAIGDDRSYALPWLIEHNQGLVQSLG